MTCVNLSNMWSSTEKDDVANNDWCVVIANKSKVETISSGPKGDSTERLTGS